MFTGLIEESAQVISWESQTDSIVLFIRRPNSFKDLQLGDSVAVNGVCLTLESLTEQDLRFTLAAETIKVLGIGDTASQARYFSVPVNLERPLKVGDRLHGHWVTGHVDIATRVLQSREQEQGWYLEVMVPQKFKKYVWPKGSICLQGVSLTINQVTEQSLSVFLIPETIKKTNLTQLKQQDFINMEFDYLAKTIVATTEAWRASQNDELRV